MAFFREDALKINGFNSDFVGWGREDSEIAVRLFNSGIGKKRVKFNALTYHIYHKENDRSGLAENDEFLAEVIKQKKKKAEKGLDSYEGC